MVGALNKAKFSLPKQTLIELYVPSNTKTTCPFGS